MGVHQEFKKANSWKGGRGWLAILKPEPENLAYCWAQGYPPKSGLSDYRRRNIISETGEDI